MFSLRSNIGQWSRNFSVHHRVSIRSMLLLRECFGFSYMLKFSHPFTSTTFQIIDFQLFSATPERIYLNAIGPQFYISYEACLNTSLIILSFHDDIIATLKQAVSHAVAKISEYQFFFFARNSPRFFPHCYS